MTGTYQWEPTLVVKVSPEGRFYLLFGRGAGPGVFGILVSLCSEFPGVVGSGELPEGCEPWRFGGESAP